uniref:Putative chaperonin n=1 Tax=viral metagenome TaxID=1070528 RepID=A0A6M3L944_9ZZZZ
METRFEPLGDRVLVLPDPVEDVTVGGIIIPDTAKGRQVQGTVVATGPGRWHAESQTYTPLSVKAGDRVLYGKYAGTDITVDDMDYVVTTEEDIMGIVRVVGMGVSDG